jgi:glycosyltransferase involved in cell wall biosynthesis
MSKIDISVIVNLHAEGMKARSSFISIAHAKAYAEGRGLRVEVLAVLDRPSNETAEFVDSCDVVDFRRIEVSFGDLGRARNAGTAMTKGDWVSFLDADDMWGENWLTAAYEAGMNDPRPIVWHPLCLIYFGAQRLLFIHVDSEDADFDPLNLSMANYWSSQSFARRGLYLSVPYPETDLERQQGYEDWGWNIETFSRGFIHKYVPNTVSAIRRQRDSLHVKTFARKAMPKASRLFCNLIMKNAK